MNSIITCSAQLLVTFFTMPMSAWGDKTLQPPFGLNWGDPPEKLIQWASRCALDVTIILPADQQAHRILKIESKKGNLPDIEASCVEGRFSSGKLYEVTVHFSDPKASTEELFTKFSEFKKQITSEQGPMKPNQQGKTTTDNYIIHNFSFYHSPVRGLTVSLLGTQVEDILRGTSKFRFSLQYRNDNMLIISQNDPK